MSKLKILVLPSWKKSTCEEIAKSFGLSKVEFTFAKYKRVVFVFDNSGVKVTYKNKDLSTFDYVWLSSMWTSRDVAHAIHLYLEFHKVKHSYVEPSPSKITDQMVLALEGILTPKTWYRPGFLKKESLQSIEKVCTYPMIIKDKLGSKGDSVQLIKDHNTLQKFYNQSEKAKRYLVQGYIPNDFEWGLIVSNGKVVSVEKKFAKEGEHRNNVHMGGSEEFIDIEETPKYIQEIAIKTANLLQLQWCRVDVLEDRKTSEVYILEVNRFPGITGGSTEIDAAVSFLSQVI